MSHLEHLTCLYLDRVLAAIDLEIDLYETRADDTSVILLLRIIFSNENI